LSQCPSRVLGSLKDGHDLELSHSTNGKNLIACSVKSAQFAFPGVFPSFRKIGKSHFPVSLDDIVCVYPWGQPLLNWRFAIQPPWLPLACDFGQNQISLKVDI
jgi:hypothetical protein